MERCYIVTHGPHQDNANDFWQMVWEQKPVAIAMLQQRDEVCTMLVDTRGVAFASPLIAYTQPYKYKHIHMTYLIFYLKIATELVLIAYAPGLGCGSI